MKKDGHVAIASGPISSGSHRGVQSVASVAASVAVPTSGVALRKTPASSPFVVLEERALSAQQGALKGALAPTHTYAVPTNWGQGQTIVEAVREHAAGILPPEKTLGGEPKPKRPRVD